MSMVKEFRDFAMRGNVVDLAIGVIIGAAFGKIVDSLVNDIIMPIIGAITGGLDFSNFSAAFASRDGECPGRREKAGRRARLGRFATIVLNFLIVAFVSSSSCGPSTCCAPRSCRTEGGRGRRTATAPGNSARTRSAIFSLTGAKYRRTIPSRPQAREMTPGFIDASSSGHRHPASWASPSGRLVRIMRYRGWSS